MDETTGFEDDERGTDAPEVEVPPYDESPCRVTFCSAPAGVIEYDLVRGVCRWCREVIAEINRQVEDDDRWRR